MNNQESCTCDECVSACRHKPGWFKPGEAEKVAEFLGMSLQQLFNEKLQADYWVGDRYNGSGDILNLAPGIVEELEEGRKMTSFFPRGTCVFLKNNLCEIHPVKPFECKATVSCNDSEHQEGCHKEAGMAWNNLKDQAQVTQLLEEWDKRNA